MLLLRVVDGSDWRVLSPDEAATHNLVEHKQQRFEHLLDVMLLGQTRYAGYLHGGCHVAMACVAMACDLPIKKPNGFFENVCFAISLDGKHPGACLWCVR